MKISEKILFCRKRAGLSQEALAEKLGVSRQAVSKWENGESAPDLEKLMLLSKTFGVTADWLLSEEEPKEEPVRKNDWVDRLPGMLRHLISRYGWLAGVRVAVSGLGVAFIGGLSRAIIKQMLSGLGAMTANFGAMSIAGGFPQGFGLPGMMEQADMISGNPVYLIGTAFLVIGILLTAVGVILTVCLKKRSDEEGEP